MKKTIIIIGLIILTIGIMLGVLSLLMDIFDPINWKPENIRYNGINYVARRELAENENCTELKKREWFVISYAYRKGESQCQVIEVNTLPI